MAVLPRVAGCRASVGGSLLLSRRRPEWRARVGARAAWAVACRSSLHRRRGDFARTPFARHACRDAPAQLTTVTLRRGLGLDRTTVSAPPGSRAVRSAVGGVWTAALLRVPGSRCQAVREGGTTGSGELPRWMVPMASVPPVIVGIAESMGLQLLGSRVLLESSARPCRLSHFGC